MIHHWMILPALCVSMGAAQAGQVCDITDLPCWGAGTKCNIKFRNETGLSTGSHGPCSHDQDSLARTIRVETRDSDGNRSGSNTLSITAGESGTDNLDKKKDFWDIKIKADGFYDVILPREDIRTVLLGSGNCKVYLNTTEYYNLEYNCDGGNVSSNN